MDATAEVVDRLERRLMSLGVYVERTARESTDDTHVMGEFWRIFGEGDDREVRSIQGQPHVWEQVLFYLAALEAYPPDDLEFEPATMAGVTGALRE